MDDMNAEVVAEAITIRELQRNAAEIFDRAQHGESFIVTRRGEKVGRIFPPDPADEAIAQAIADGILDPVAFANLPTAADLPHLPRIPLTPGEPSWSEVIIAMRDEERY